MAIAQESSNVIRAIFNQPRALYTEMLRTRYIAEVDAVLALMRFYSKHHDDVVITNGRAERASGVIALYELARSGFEEAKVLRDVRDVNKYLTEINAKSRDTIETVHFMLALIHGYTD